MDSPSQDASARKRNHFQDDPVPTPPTLKKRRLDQLAPGSPSTPKALDAVNSAYPSAISSQNAWPPVNINLEVSNSNPLPTAPSSQPSSQAPPPASAAPKFRPAIKLSALKGTIWDNQEAPRPVPLPKKVGPGRPRTTTAKKPPGPRGRPRKKKVQEGGEENREATQVQESADELATANGNLSVSKPTPKGILTPTKKGRPRGRPPKNVSFGAGQDRNGEVFFEDLPKKAKTPRKTADSEADELVCAICIKPHSQPPNQIILCDMCDFAVHQECYGVPDIPEGDWLCKSCTQEDILKTPKKTPGVEVPTIKIAADVPDIANLEQHVRSLQRILLDRCTGRRRLQLPGQLEAEEKVYQLVEQTVVAGEGNSMLVIGGRGCGKTTLLEKVISDVSQEHKNDFHVVRLNGFIHTDDKLALKEIWRQLGKEMQVEDDLVNRTNYADTMASLLALLSHPSEIIGTDEGVTSQSIVFVIDEFDMFASHPRQTLLYNLFDIAQSRKAPIAVIGCTTRLDVVEMLEKRVKSRFSHRYVYLSLPRNLPAYWQVCRQGLIVDSDEAEKEGINTYLEGHAEFQQYWSQKIEGLYRERSFQDLLQYHYYTTKSTSAFLTEWILPLSALSANDVTLRIPSVQGDVESLTAPDSRLHLLSTLSELDLGLLIAAARLDIVAHTDTVNLAMAYDEYSSLMGKQRVHSAAAGMLAVGGGVRVWSRGVAGIAWERLISLGLLVPAGIGGARNLGHGGLEGKMWKVDVALEEIPAAVKLNAVLARWCREI
ncbi:origin recognition complex subunit 4 [Fusarium subglutinans]|uniref:Origin recognition complex subunit 4 n=1 Tax=Gibberella subglutinans TaxID=42677 RepID=A0A8H5PGW1_GIBSU|nr:origin recognition complex subunit 4 [Fusarium subglutinans]KAF5596108.1 origin recognition complex subunit 4 [Fusarium subglutinans]